MNDLYEIIEKELEQGQDLAVATIVAQTGSAPRAPGTRFLIRPDGSFEGTIGGGRLEADVLVEASKLFSEKKNRTIRFRLTGEEASETEMICGGELEIHLEFFSGEEPSSLDFFKRVADLRQKGARAIVVTRLGEGRSSDLRDSKFLYLSGEDSFTESPDWLNPVRKELSEVFSKGQSLLVTTSAKGEEKKFFLEPLISSPHLYIFGAGHVSAALGPLAKKVGFQVTVIDDRVEFAHPARFPEADEIVVRPFDRLWDSINIGPHSFVTIMTRGHLHDHLVLRQVLKKTPRYIGMIGSRHKRKVIFEALKEEGFPEDMIKSVHTPIGLDIQAETPEEIAVSIVAELIQVRNRIQTGQESIRKLPH